VGEFVPGYDAAGWYGVGAPKSTPADIVDKLNREVNAGLADTKLKARLADVGVESTPILPNSASSSPTTPRSGAR
jgi:tripartite-type tricarboxylate transporter receptor subunit TctC